MCNMRTIGPAVSEKKIFEIVDDDGRTDEHGRTRTDAGAWVYYKLTYEPSGELKMLDNDNRRTPGACLSYRLTCEPSARVS